MNGIIFNMAQSKKIITYSIVAGVAAIVIFIAWPQNRGLAPDRPVAIIEQKALSSALALEINSGDGAIWNFDSVQFSAGENLFQILKRKMADEKITFEFKEYPGLGVLVTRIGERKNGEQGKYWQYWVNGAYADKGPDAYVVKPGDAIEWRFEGSKQ